MRTAALAGLALLTLLPATRLEPEEAKLPSTVISWEEIQARPRPGGRSWQVVEAPTATLFGIESHVTELAAGQAPHPPHRHFEEELLLVKEGTLEVTIEGVAKRIGPGGFVFVASNDLHGWRNAGDTTARYFVIQIRTRPR